MAETGAMETIIGALAHPMDPATIRERMLELEAAMHTLPDEQKIEMDLTHHFSHGVYARELAVPKDSFGLGKIHKFSNLNILAKGEVSVLTDTGLKRICAPAVWVAPAGVKRLVFAHEDSVWVTVLGTHDTDIDKIESDFIAASFADVPAWATAEPERQVIDGW